MTYINKNNAPSTEVSGINKVLNAFKKLFQNNSLADLTDTDIASQVFFETVEKQAIKKILDGHFNSSVFTEERFENYQQASKFAEHCNDIASRTIGDPFKALNSIYQNNLSSFKSISIRLNDKYNIDTLKIENPDSIKITVNSVAEVIYKVAQEAKERTYYGTFEDAVAAYSLGKFVQRDPFSKEAKPNLVDNAPGISTEETQIRERKAPLKESIKNGLKDLDINEDLKNKITSITASCVNFIGQLLASTARKELDEKPKANNSNDTKEKIYYDTLKKLEKHYRDGCHIKISNEIYKGAQR